MKKIIKHSLIITFIVGLILALLPLLGYLPIISEFIDTINDFDITDVGMSAVKEEMYQSADTNIVMINTSKIKAELIEDLIVHVSNAGAKVIAVSLDNIKDISIRQKLIELSKEKTNIILGDRKGNNFNGMINNEVNPKHLYSTTREFNIYCSNNSANYSFISLIIQRYSKDLFNNLLNRNSKNELINYRGNYKKFYNFSASEMIEDSLNFNVLKSKIVLIGDIMKDNNNANLNDLYFTPMNENVSGRTIPDMSLIEIQANAISMILNNDYTNRNSIYVSIAIALFGVFFNCVLYYTLIDWSEKLYELISLLLFMVESFGIIILSIQIRHNYNFEMGLSILLLSIALGLLIFEIYNESVIPIYHIIKKERH